MKCDILFDDFPNIDTDELKIHQITMIDANDFAQIYLNPNCFKYTPGTARKTYEAGINIIKHIERNFIKRKFVFSGLYLNDNKLIGILEIFNIDKKKEEAEIGYRINEKYWNKGYTKRGILILINYLFEIVNVRKINACAMIENIASNKILESLGFILYKQTFHEEEWKDKGFVDLNYYYKEKG